MHCSISIRASSLECASCGKRNKRMLSNEYTCMSCGIIDGSVMIVDETSEQRKQWENSENDTHANKYVKGGGGATQASTKALLFASRPPRPTADRRVLEVAKRASGLFSIESDQIPLEATSLYMATATSSSSISQVRVVACAMIVAQRRSAQDILDVALTFKLKQKNVSGAIEAVQAAVRTGHESLGHDYGYLFQSVGDRRTSQLVKEALDHLVLSLSAVHPSHTRQALLRPAWGIRSLADDMMNHVQDCRLIGGDSLQILARVLVVLSCELLGLSVAPVPPDFVSNTMLQHHRGTWRDAVVRWAAEKGGEFDLLVARKRRTTCSAPAVPVPVPARHDPPGPGSVLAQCKRATRSSVAAQFGVNSSFQRYVGTGVAAGVTHLCVVLVAGNADIKASVTANGVSSLMAVCLAAVTRTELDLRSLYDLRSLVENTQGYPRELALAQNFRTTLPTSSASSCFMPRELMRWEGGPRGCVRLPPSVAGAPSRTSVCLRRLQ